MHDIPRVIHCWILFNNDNTSWGVLVHPQAGKNLNIGGGWKFYENSILRVFHPTFGVNATLARRCLRNFWLRWQRHCCRTTMWIWDELTEFYVIFSSSHLAYRVMGWRARSPRFKSRGTNMIFAHVFPNYLWSTLTIWAVALYTWYGPYQQQHEAL